MTLYSREIASIESHVNRRGWSRATSRIQDITRLTNVARILARISQYAVESRGTPVGESMNTPRSKLRGI